MLYTLEDLRNAFDAGQDNCDIANDSYFYKNPDKAFEEFVNDLKD